MTQIEKNNERFKEVFIILDEVSYVLRQTDNKYCQQKVEDASKILKNKVEEDPKPTENFWKDILKSYKRNALSFSPEEFCNWLEVNYNVPTKK